MQSSANDRFLPVHGANFTVDSTSALGLIPDSLNYSGCCQRLFVSCKNILAYTRQGGQKPQNLPVLSIIDSKKDLINLFHIKHSPTTGDYFHLGSNITVFAMNLPDGMIHFYFSLAIFYSFVQVENPAYILSAALV